MVGFLNIVSTPGKLLSRSGLGLLRFVTRLTWARFGQVGDQVGQGQGQELDKNEKKIASKYIFRN